MKRTIILSLVLVSSKMIFAQSYGDYDVVVNVEGNGFAHYTTIYFDDESWDPQNPPTFGWDACCDASLIVANANQPHVFTEVVAPPTPPNNPRLSINGMPHITQQTDVPMGFLPGELALYEFTFKELYTLPVGMGVELEDLAQNVTQDLLADSTYDTWSAPSDDELRFIIHFYPLAVSSDTKVEKEHIETQFSVADGNIMISFGERLFEGNVSIYDSVGRAVYAEDVRTQSKRVRLSNNPLTRGVYIVRVTSKHGETISKKIAFQ